MHAASICALVYTVCTALTEILKMADNASVESKHKVGTEDKKNFFPVEMN